MHGQAGTFDIPLPLSGDLGIECRRGSEPNGDRHQVMVSFAKPITVSSADLVSGTGSVDNFSVSGTEVTINLTGVTNTQRVTVALANVDDGVHVGEVAISMGVLAGDGNGNAVANASDVSLTKSQVGQAVTFSNFRQDGNANGAINSSDVSFFKANVGPGLP